MNPTKITVRLLEKLKPGDRVSDTEAKGLFAEAGRAGEIRLRFKSEMRAGAKTGSARAARTVQMTLGVYPEFSLDQARHKAAELKQAMKAGQDPRTGTPRAHDMWTVERLMDEYAEDLRKTNGSKAERTIADMKVRYDNYLAPRWASTLLTAITGEMARDLHAHITAHGKNGRDPDEHPDKAQAPVAANDTLRNFRAAFNWARKTQPALKLGENPVYAVTFNKQRPRTDSLTLPDLRAWERKVAKIKNPIRRDMHRFGLFSGLRPGCLVLLERAWIRFDNKALCIPKEVMKMENDFHLPLSDHMIELLKRIIAAGDMLFPGSIYLFPTKGNRTRRGPVIATKVWKEAGMASETGHILRHIYSNVGQAAGESGSRYSDVEMSLLLAHKVPGIKGVYLNAPYLFKCLLLKQEQITAFLLKEMAPRSGESEDEEDAPRRTSNGSSKAKGTHYKISPRGVDESVPRNARADIPAAEKVLASLGFKIRVDGNVRSCIRSWGDLTVYADPRSGGVLKFDAYRGSKYLDTFGVKDKLGNVQAKVEAQLRKLS